MQHGVEIEYPVTISIAYKTASDTSAKLSKRVGGQYTALVEMVVSLLADENAAQRACDVLVEAGLSEGPKQTYLDYSNAQSPPIHDETNGNGQYDIQDSEQLEFSEAEENSEDQEFTNTEALDEQLDEPEPELEPELETRPQRRPRQSRRAQA